MGKRTPKCFEHRVKSGCRVHPLAKLAVEQYLTGGRRKGARYAKILSHHVLEGTTATPPLEQRVKKSAACVPWLSSKPSGI